MQNTPTFYEIQDALSWGREHAQQVARLIATANEAYPPTGFDCSRPEAWKSEHWNWLRLWGYL